MTINFFKGIETREELRKAYLRLMKTYHPDCGGDTEICKAINNEYDYLSTVLPTSKDQDTNTSKDVKKEIKVDAAIKTIIDKLMHMNGVKIEICGSWVWVDGNTYEWKDELAALGFKWSKPRRKWHYTPYDTGYRRGCRKSFNEIRAAYGSMNVETIEYAAIAG